MATEDGFPREVAKYFRNFDQEARILPDAQRRTLRSQLEDHVREVLVSTPTAPRLDDVLADLGDPRELVEEELRQGGEQQKADRSPELGRILFYVLLIVGVLLTLAAVWLLLAGVVMGAFPPWWWLGVGTLSAGGVVLVGASVRRLRDRRS